MKVAASQVFSKAATPRPSALTPFIAVVLHRRRDVRGAFVPGKLQAYLDAQYAPLSDVIQACIVRHSDQLVSARSCPTLPTERSGSGRPPIAHVPSRESARCCWTFVY